MQVIIIGGVAGGASCTYATRVLLQNGFDVKNISGGTLSRSHASFFLQEGHNEN